MTNKQLQDILKNYPECCQINVERCGIQDEGEILSVRAVYTENDDFGIPLLTLEYIDNA